jgi:tRNA pseudouridine55 synthase
VFRLELTEAGEAGVWQIEVECSAGTYVRSLAADLGTLLGGGAHLRRLRRTAVGDFTIEEAGPPDSAELLPIEAGVWALGRADVAASTAAVVGNGGVLERDGGGTTWSGQGPWAVFGPGRQLLAVYEARDVARVKPAVVLPRASAG